MHWKKRRSSAFGTFLYRSCLSPFILHSLHLSPRGRLALAIQVVQWTETQSVASWWYIDTNVKSMVNSRPWHPSLKQPWFSDRPKAPRTILTTLEGGQLGQNDQLNIGDSANELGDALPAINLGSTALKVPGKIAAVLCCFFWDCSLFLLTSLGGKTLH